MDCKAALSLTAEAFLYGAPPAMLAIGGEGTILGRATLMLEAMSDREREG